MIHLKSWCSVLLWALCCGAVSAEPAAQIDHPQREQELTRIRLSAAAQQQLAIQTVPVEAGTLPRTQLFGAELLLPQSRESAILPAVLANLSTGELGRLAQAQLDADGKRLQADIQQRAAQRALQRAEQMRRDKVGTERSEDEARVQLELANLAVQQAHASRALLGAALTARGPYRQLWLRVPIQAGDLARIDLEAAASVGDLNGRPTARDVSAQPLNLAPIAQSASAETALYYSVAQPPKHWQPGLRVGVRLALHAVESIGWVPSSALLYDAHGGHWLYENPEPGVYVRRRVQLADSVGDKIALSAGVRVGMPVVRQGAAELFGIEFGVGR